VKFVRECDLIIRVFNTLWRRLVIVWDGPDRKELEKWALDNIQFLWHIESIDRKMQLFAAAKWHINLAQESFGLATVESLLCWCPVFGYNYWGSAELVRQNSGLLISSKSEHNIIDKLKEFDTMTFDRVSIQATIRSQIANHPFPDHFL
jgi:glycosyltransferase involved in cell wall biosynthesis